MPKRHLRKSVKRWGGLWTFLLLVDIVRFMRRRRRRVTNRKVLKEGEVLIISSTVSPDRK